MFRMGYFHLFLLMLCLLSRGCLSWGEWFSSSSSASDHSDEKHSNNGASRDCYIAEFSMEISNTKKGIEKLENARRKLSDTTSCWNKAYQSLFSACSEIINNNEKRQRLAWHLSDCFQQDSGGHPFPSCSSRSSMKDCLGKLKEEPRRTYLEFYLETNSICQELQAHTFRRQTERLVNDLRGSAEYAEQKLEKIDETSNQLLRNAKETEESLAAIELRTQQLSQTSKDVRDNVEAVLSHSRAVFEQSKGIASSQLELQEGQAQIKDKLEEGMAMVHDSYQMLGQDVDFLRNETVEIEKEIGKVGKTMSSKMKILQKKANDIESIAGVSLDKQKELLGGQTMALEGLQFLTLSQTQALEESRNTLEKLAEFGRKQQEELLARQEQLQQAHDHLVESSKTIIEAQEMFESKQATMFISLEKLFNLHNAMLLESRVIKTFILYSISTFIIYMFTSTKQTYAVRPRLYIGLTVTIMIEFLILRSKTDDIEALWIIDYVRLLFVLLASLQLIHAIYTYRDYEMLNHKMLLALNERVSGMERKRGWFRGMDEDEEDDDIDWSTWIDSDIVEDVDDLQDPDFAPLHQLGGYSVAKTLSTFTRSYSLRPR